METEIQSLFSMIRTAGPYPPGIQRISGEFSGNPFFPGSTGIMTDDQRLSGRRVMIVGHQFDACYDFCKTYGHFHPFEGTTPAWSTLLYLLIRGGVDPLNSFFTNVLPGMPVDGSGSKDTEKTSLLYFRQHGRELFRRELEIQRPQVILVLGIKTARSLGWLNPKLASWTALKSYAEADRLGLSLIPGVPVAAGSEATLLLLTHPAQRNAKVVCRRFGDATGDDAEVGMVTSAMR